MGDEAVFQKFSEYEDENGYYFLSFMEECSEDDTFEWTYYPPSSFKILIYFPEYDSFLTDDIVYERYAFDSYFTVEADISDGNEIKVIQTEKSYDFSMEMISLLARVVITILVEMLIVFLFMPWDKKTLKVIACTNLVTQLILNILLNLVNYKSGQYAFIFNYAWMECVVCVIEAVVYCKIWKRDDLKKGYVLIGYAIVANIVSFFVGMGIAKMIPGIF